MNEPNADLFFESINDIPSEIATIRPQCTWHRTSALWGELREGIFLLTDGYSLAALNYAERVCTYQIHSKTLENLPFFYRSFLLIPLLELLKTFGLFYVHGSFVTKKDRGILFLGAGGTGKSTFSATLVREGWRWVSDDNMLLHISAGKLRLTAFEQEFSLHPNVAASLNLENAGYIEHEKIRVPHDRLPKDQLATDGIPTDLILLEGSTSLLVDEQKSTLLHALLRENPTLPLHAATGTAGFSLYRHLVSESRTQSIRAGWRDIPRLTYFWSAV